MKDQNIKKTEYLFDEIGGVSDILITEAALYRTTKKSRHHTWIKVLSVAACLLLCFTLTAHTLISLFEKSFTNDETSSTVLPNSLDGLLCDGEEIRYTTLSSVGELDLLGNAAYVVWQEEGSELLCVSRELTALEVQNLKARINTGNAVTASTPTPACRVWIVCGDGTVVSPYLKQSDGNVGVGALFDYEPELIPSSSFTSYVSDILTEP